MSLLTVEQALQIVLNRCKPLPSVVVPLPQSVGCSLAEDAVARVDLPSFDNSAVDGYAVRSADICDACSEKPVSLPLTLVQAAGSSPGLLAAGGVARVLTGGPVPAGADTVIMQEDVLCRDQAVEFSHPSTPGMHIRRRASDIAQGEIVLGRGIKLGAVELAALTAAGCTEVCVTRPPRIAIVTTGDEVLPLSDTALPPGSIFNSNAVLMNGLLAASGFAAAEHVHLPDDLDQTVCAFENLVNEQYDAIVCAGGVSVGDRDYVKPAIEAIGKLEMWRVALKPGKPLAFGSIGSTLFFGLPGNPASVMVTFELFVRPALCMLAGQTAMRRPVVNAVLQNPVEHDPGRREYVRAQVSWRNGACLVNSTGEQGSSRLRSLCGANALLIVPENSDGYQAGDTVAVMLLSDALLEHP